MSNVLDLNKLTKLENLNCSHNFITNVILCLSLKSINCSYCNFVGTLDFSKFSNLTELNCSYNRISKLILPDKITYLDCCRNELFELQVPNTVMYLDCSHNYLTQIVLFNDGNKKIIYNDNTTNCRLLDRRE